MSWPYTPEEMAELLESEASLQECEELTPTHLPPAARQVRDLRVMQLRERGLNFEQMGAIMGLRGGTAHMHYNGAVRREEWRTRSPWKRRSIVGVQQQGAGASSGGGALSGAEKVFSRDASELYGQSEADKAAAEYSEKRRRWELAGPWMCSRCSQVNSWWAPECGRCEAPHT